MFEEKTLGLKDLKFSIIEGFFATILLSAGISFIVPFALFLGASSVEIGFLAAFPALFAAWLQLFSLRILEIFKKRKEMVVIFTILQVIFFLPIVFMPFIFQENQVFWLIFFYTLSLVSGALAGPIWQSWMKAIVPKKNFGSFFGFRNSIIGISSFTFLLLFGFALNLFESNLAMVFLGIFLLAALGRFIGTIIFLKINDPPTKIKFEKKIRFVGFIKNINKNKFGHFILYGTLMSFGISLTAPFVGYHFLENIGLKSNYFFYTILISVAMVAAIIGMNYWGKLVNQFGSIKVLKATSIIVIFFPLIYIFIRDPFLLIFVQFFDGLVFSGFSLALATFIFDYSSDKKIIRFSSYQAVFFGSAVFLGAIIGGYIQTIEFNFFIIDNSFYLLCLIAVLVRLTVFKLFFKKVTEVKHVDYIKTTRLVHSILTFEPVLRMIPRVVIFEREARVFNFSIQKRLVHINKLIDDGSKKLSGVVKRK